jgi:hypothetical protein
MRRLLPVVVILVLGCSGGSGSAPTASAGPGSTGAPTTTPTGASNAPADSPAASAGAGAVLPAECAKGLGDYLVAIEPIVSKFDLKSAKMGDLPTLDEAVRSKSMELLTANDSRAPYSCSEVGLEWAYFDASTPWEAVLAVAGEKAPGTIPYLTATRSMSEIDVAEVGDYGVSGCDDAVAKIKADVAASGSGVEDMSLEDGLKLLGLYKAYMHEVQNEACPRDELGNDEFDFFGAMG